MKQKRIDYIDVMDLGFEEEFPPDDVFYNKYGYEYSLVTKWVAKDIFLDWDKTTGFCEMIRVKGEGENILGRMPIIDLDHLERMIAFFSEEKTSKEESVIA